MRQKYEEEAKEEPPTRVTVLGEIAEASGFDSEVLYIRY
jgi:hypothetical protein